MAHILNKMRDQVRNILKATYEEKKQMENEKQTSPRGSAGH